MEILSHLRPRFAYTTYSVIMGMGGAKAGISPPRRSPPWTYMEDNVAHVVPAREKSDLDQVLDRKRPRSR